MCTVDVLGAADLMKVHPKTVLEMIDKGMIPAAKLGRAYVMLQKDVIALVESMIIKQTKERMTRSPQPLSKR